MRILGRSPDKDESTPICAEGGAIMNTSILDSVSHTGFVFKVTHQSDVGSGNTASIVFTVAQASSVPTPSHVHFSYSVHCEGEAEIAFYEDVERTANTGNAVTPICLNRSIGKVSAWGSSSVYKDATLNTSNATLLDVEVLGSKKTEGGDSPPMFNWTLCRGKTYAIIVTNQSGAANETTIKITWGRHVEVS